MLSSVCRRINTIRPIVSYLKSNTAFIFLQHNNFSTTTTTTTADNFDDNDLGDRETMEFDVVIVGGGPAGLSSAIRLKQLSIEHDVPLQVCVLEKGSEIGAHIMSGNVFNPISLNELLPDWQSSDAPIHQPVTADEFWLLSADKKLSIPFLPSSIRNDNNYIISLSDLCRWLAEQAESLEVDILAGFSASEALYNSEPGKPESQSQLIGVATSDLGLLKDSTPGPNFERGCEILARQTILAEGCRGSISESVMSQFNLRAQSDPQIYGIGFKEVWQLDANSPHLDDYYQPGLVVHALGFPLPSDLYGGSYIYHAANHQIFLGCVIGLDYTNPYFNPYLEFQKFKTHPAIAPLLMDTNAECVGYGARALNSGGYQSIPELSFPGGCIVGCSAGFVNVPKVKGTHYAMKTGMLAAEQIFDAIKDDILNGVEINSANSSAKSEPETGTETGGTGQRNVVSYTQAVHDSWVMKDLYSVRNVKPAFNYGRIPGLIHSALSTVVTKGYEPWTLRSKYSCAEKTLPAAQCEPIEYEKNDGRLTFDILTNLSRTGTYHHESEPSHLRIKEEFAYVADYESYDVYAAPETRFCPAKVYEFVENSETNKMELVINSQNCIHCKTCSIKTPKEYIEWTVPQGGGGPKYAGM